jgi:hypothetical protein
MGSDDHSLRAINPSRRLNLTWREQTGDCPQSLRLKRRSERAVWIASHRLICELQLVSTMVRRMHHDPCARKQSPTCGPRSFLPCTARRRDSALLRCDLDRRHFAEHGLEQRELLAVVELGLYPLRVRKTSD